jgi:hypothetical protein
MNNAVTLHTMANLAFTLTNQSRFKESTAMLKLVLSKQQKILGLEYPETLKTAGHLSASLWGLGLGADAEALTRQTLATWQKLVPDDHPCALHSAADLEFITSGHARGALEVLDGYSRGTKGALQPSRPPSPCGCHCALHTTSVGNVRPAPRRARLVIRHTKDALS